MGGGHNYNRKFEENILIAGQTGCGKITCIQKLAKNKIFRDLNVDNNIDVVLGENNIFDKLIFMDGVSRIADKSDNFANFLTVSIIFSFDVPYKI